MILVGLLAVAIGSVVAESLAADSVPWEDYDPMVKIRIDAHADRRDCAGLMEEFDEALADSNATLRRTGHTNLNLMGYIHEKLRDAGCPTD